MLRLFEGEAGETDYWLEVIQSAGYFSDEEYASLDATLLSQRLDVSGR